MGQSTHVAGLDGDYPVAHGVTAPPPANQGNGPVLNSANGKPTMTSEAYNRRHTDRGYVPQLPAPIAALRNALGLVPVTESLGSLAHWRRRRDAQAETAGS